MPHLPRILCSVCHKLEAMPTGPGMPECDCEAQGYGPCKTYPCLSCIDKASRPKMEKLLKDQQGVNDIDNLRHDVNLHACRHDGEEDSK